MGKDETTAEEVADSVEDDLEGETIPSTSEPDVGAAVVVGKGVEGDGNSVDKIREILFGNHKREFSRRLGELEESYRKELEAVRHEHRQRHDALETYLRREIDALADQVLSEQRQRAEQIRELTEEVEKIRKTLEKRMDQLDEDTRKAAKDFRQQLLEQTKTLSAEILRQSEAAASRFAAAQQDMREEMVDRSSLGALFTRMGMQLASEVTGAGEDR
jgi:vacuolar-type H+-ATPase subunit I/STV1